MPVSTPCLDGSTSSAYTYAGVYRGFSSPAYAEVASACPGSDTHVQLYADLDNLMLDCCKPNWDGHGAEPITLEAFQIAKRFIQSLPAGIPRPTLSADPDGFVTFEWRVAPRRLLLASIHPDYRIDYAALFGTAKSYGTEPFFDMLPTGIRDLVSRVYQA